MKFSKLLLVAAALLVTSCGEEETTSDENQEVTNTENENNNQEPTKTYGKSVTESKWGFEAAKASYDTLGTVIPYLESDSFEYEVTVDDYGDPAIWFYLYYESEEVVETKLDDYSLAAYEQSKYKCVINENRFIDYETLTYVEVNVLYADKNLSKTKAVEIMGLASSKNGKACMGLFCFNYIPNLEPHNFPTYAVENLLGKDNELPTLSTVNDELTYDFSFMMQDGMRGLIITVESSGNTIELEEKYFYELVNAEFLVYQFDELDEKFTGETYIGYGEYPGFEDNLFYYALSPEEEYMLTFDYNIDKNVFIISILDEIF